ncbi:MAG TPA: heme biosynthesis HemY N-terminal domain-containing protein, partial [Pseudomonadales bacterium]|nr:heme biosynthesis HemY N-terminal domain-containing protein [Pseudomonadales bacterium]
MRRVFVVLLLILATAASLAYLVRLDAGYVLVELHGITVETTVWVAALAALAALLTFYYVARLLVIVADALTRLLTGRVRRHEGFLGRWRARRRVHTMRGVLAFFEGRWRDAVKQLARGARSADAPLLNHLLAARASHELGDDELAEGFLQLAGEVPDAAPAVALVRAAAALERGEHVSALAILDGAALDPRTQPAGTALLLEALERADDWERIRSLLPDARHR